MCAASQTRKHGIPKSNKRVLMIKNTLKAREEDRSFSDTVKDSIRIITGRKNR